MLDPKIIVAIVVIILLVILLNGNNLLSLLPNKIWGNKHIRGVSRACESIVGNPDMVNRPITSYYRKFDKQKYGKNNIVVGFHYTNWCSYCNLMKPVWEQVKRNIQSDSNMSAVTFIENDEDKNPTSGVNVYPTIIKYRGGKARKYKGLADYDQLRSFVLTPFQVDTAGSHF